ncbi:MAG: CehA/McbA family metallohydrolase [Candidatus Hydrogenedentes bacterium]|nr:CehA/McbA family metallohydrolase [Candidatus Hydrogenedentota bacterium]
MIDRRLLSTKILASAAILVACASAAPAQSNEEMQGVVQFAGSLAQYRVYLFPEATFPEVDTLNRDLREAQGQARRADGDARNAALVNWAQGVARLEKLMTSVQSAISITVGDTKKVLPAHAPIAFPAGSGALMFHVNAGAGPAKYVVVENDFSEVSKSRVRCEVSAGAETWVLVTLTSVPMLKTIQEYEFPGVEPAKTILPMAFTTPDRGTIRIAIRSLDVRGAVPAMLRITSKFDGRDVRPGGALDFAPQFDHQGNFSGPRRTNLPGKLSGSYWCVPGETTTAVPPGDYAIVIERGVEHVAVFDTVHVESHETVEREYMPLRWVDMRKRGWWSGDDHVHCQILNDTDARVLSTWTRAEDVRLANVVKMGDIYRTWFEQRGFGPAYRVENNGYILCPGQECPRTHNELGHSLHMNITHMIRDTDRYYLYDTVFDAVHADGGLSGYAHVNTNLFHVDRDMSINIPKQKVDFIELLQFANLGTDLFYDFLNTGFKVTASAGSDVPWGGTVGEVRVYAYLGRKGFSADRWFEAVRQGHTFVTNGVMIDLNVDHAMPGDQITVKQDRPLRVRARAWGDPQRATPAKLEIVVHGDVIKTVAATAQEAELATEFDLPAGDGLWISARAEGTDGSRAHTTPVYVIREGLRFWKYDALDQLIAKRLASLAEVEKIVADAQAQDREGKVDDNRPIKQLALQSPELLERVKDARAIYTELQATMERERPLRHKSNP